jgi:hypothetical protein
MTIIAIARAIHILSGVVWAGFAVVLATLVFPKLAPDGRSALGLYMGQYGSRVAGAAAGLTFLSGLYLMWRLHWGERSAMAATLGIGALLAILAGISGGAISGRAAAQLAKLTPGPDAAAKAAPLRDRMILGARISAALLVLSIICMAVARYV